MNGADTPTRAERIAAARAELARRYAENPEAVERFEARKAHLAIVAKRERQRIARIGEDPRPDDPDLTRPGGMSRQDWKIERGRRTLAHRKAMDAWNQRQRNDKLNGPTPEQSAKAPYVEKNVDDYVRGQRIKIGRAFCRQPRFETIAGLTAAQIAALRRYRRTFDTSELSTVKSGLDVGVGGGIGGSEAVISRLQAVVFADVALAKIEDAVPAALLSTLRRVALHDDDFLTVALRKFGSASGQRRTKIRTEFMQATDALASAMQPRPAPVPLTDLPAKADESAQSDWAQAVKIHPAFLDERGYMLPWGEIIDIITESLRDGSAEPV